MSPKAEESKLTCLMCMESYGPSDPEYGLVCPTGERGPCGGTFACKMCLSDMVISQCENIGDFTNNGNSWYFSVHYDIRLMLDIERN